MRKVSLPAGSKPPHKTQWSTTSNQFRLVPAETPESQEWVDRPDHPARRGGGMLDPRAGIAGAQRYRHSLITTAEQVEHARRVLRQVESQRPIPVIYNDEDLPLATLAAAVLSEAGQRPVLSTPDPRLRANNMLDQQWWERLEPVLRAAEYAIDVGPPDAPPNNAKAAELRLLQSSGARIIPFWVSA